MELLKFCIFLTATFFLGSLIYNFFLYGKSNDVGFQDFDNLDSLITALVQIGFEFEDCQLAIQSGKLTADEIIDWYAVFTSWIAVYKV